MKFKLKTREPNDTALKHQLKIARSSMKMHCAGLRIMGGPNHFEAANIIHNLTGVVVNVESDCTCTRGIK